MPKDRYEKLHEMSRRGAVLGSVANLLEWDQETYMPGGANAFRAEQLAEMSLLCHKQKTSRAFAKALGDLIDLKSGKVLEAGLSPRKQAALREWRRDYLRTSLLPPSFVKKWAKTTAHASQTWSEAKAKNAFKIFQPDLTKIVELNRKKSELLGFDEHPYDALLDLFEPHMKVRILNPLFSRLKEGLKALVQAISAKPAVNTSFLEGPFPLDKQIAFGQELLHALGFDPKLARLDLSSHPFCSGFHPTDTRMTTRIDLHNPLSNIFSVIHEAGHAIYNQGLVQDEYGSPLGEQISLGIDESQSRWWETRIGRTLPFWRHFYPRLQRTFPEQLGSIPLDAFFRAVNVVTPSLIRVEADEVTYSLHVIVRFEIEKALIEGSLQVKDLPEAWNAKMVEVVGIRPENDSTGCLQDIHWSMGGFGYFPTYTLGNLYAASFFTVFEKAHPDWQARVERGELAFIRTWLGEQIHRHGREFLPEELCKRITGAPLSEKPFLDYLQAKFKPLYSL